mmetsp:Transcript_10336/g.26594  ORF Transcript_10336/g.26594 Transcript_10336/m.26594 type:complete len:262 (+) Transcript_10336:424-1209(+)
MAAGAGAGAAPDIMAAMEAKAGSSKMESTPGKSRRDESSAMPRESMPRSMIEAELSTLSGISTPRSRQVAISVLRLSPEGTGMAGAGALAAGLGAGTGAGAAGAGAWAGVGAGAWTAALGAVYATIGLRTSDMPRGPAPWTMTWALLPVKPKLLTPTRADGARGWAEPVTMARREPFMASVTIGLTCGTEYMGTRWFSSIITAFSMPRPPAADSRCPKCILAAVSRHGFEPDAEPMVLDKAVSSTGSPIRVPVPCISTASI